MAAVSTASVNSWRQSGELFNELVGQNEWRRLLQTGEWSDSRSGGRSGDLK